MSDHKPFPINCYSSGYPSTVFVIEQDCVCRLQYLIVRLRKTSKVCLGCARSSALSIASNIIEDDIAFLFSASHCWHGIHTWHQTTASICIQNREWKGLHDSANEVPLPIKTTNTSDTFRFTSLAVNTCKFESALSYYKKIFAKSTAD